MDLQQRVLFTALPTGHDTETPGKYRLSVHISPRLSNIDNATTALSSFSDWENWPATVGAMTWSVAFGGGAPAAATVVSDAPDGDLWQALFAANTIVQSHVAQKPLHNNKVKSYPNKNIQEFIRDRYTDVATKSPDEYPHIDDILHPDMLGSLNPGLVFGSTGAGSVEQQLTNNKAVTNGLPLTNVPADFYQLDRFHRPRHDGKGAPVATPTLDFHAAVATIGQHPALMRLLGLVVDLTFEIADADLPAGPTFVTASSSWVPAIGGPEGSPPVISVRTRCEIGPGQFEALPHAVNPELTEGRLPFNDTDKFTVVAEDIDGAGLKALDFVANLNRLKQGPGGLSSGSPERYALPSIRSAGLSVARANRAPQFHERMGRADTIGKNIDSSDPEPIEVDAEDITRGYRIDVRDVSEARWFSLSARTGKYVFLNGGVEIPYSDEAWVSNVPTANGTGEDADLYLQETLFRWGGWSLAAPRPGARLATTQEEDPPITTEDDAPPPEFPMRIDRKATPGTLPRLRFGREYSVRARAVDLAGNGLPLNPDVEDRHGSPPVRYARYQPVQTPPVLPVAPRTAGESLERIVLRSNYNTDPDPNEPAARHIVPPKADQLLAEHHGMFDTAAPGSVVDPSTYTTISKYVLPTPPPGDEVLQSEQGTFATSPEHEVDTDDHQQTRYFPVDHVTLPYLPDPIARGAAFMFLDHPAEKNHLFKAPFAPGTTWPDYRPLRLVIEQPANELISQLPIYDEANHRVIVRIGKGQQIKVRLSAHLGRADLGLLGIWNWVEGKPEAPTSTRVIDGQHWMLTPYRELTLIHAVRQPLKVATFTVFEAAKELGATAATFSGFLNYSGISTSKIDVIGAWGEYIDRGPGTDPPTPVSDPKARHAVAFSIPATRDNNGGTMPMGPQFPSDRHEFGDTKHRLVTYTTVATSRYTDFFVQQEKFTVNYGLGNEMVTQLPTAGKGIVPGSVHIRNELQPEDPQDDPSTGATKGAGTYVEGPDFTVSKAGLLTIKKGGVPQFQKIVVDFLANPVTRSSQGEPSGAKTIHIKNSAPPTPPKLKYVIPSFGWSRGLTLPLLTSKRSGNGLRIYLERPWWSSGEGELLGVVIPTANSNPPATVAPFLTRWGLDPVFQSTPTTTPHPQLASFPDAVRVASGLVPHGANFSVAVAGHEVGFDEDRDLWYCDVRLGTRSYFPFVRLALVRYQPESVVGAHLSSIVVADFSQLVPDRQMSVFGTGGKRTVAVTGQSYDKAGATNQLATVRAFVEEFDAVVGGELGWSQIGDATQLTPQNKVNGNHLWQAQVTIPKGTPGRPKRVVVEEIERHRSGGVPLYTSRVVYTDNIPI